MTPICLEGGLWCGSASERHLQRDVRTFAGAEPIKREGVAAVSPKREVEFQNRRERESYDNPTTIGTRVQRTPPNQPQ